MLRFKKAFNFWSLLVVLSLVVSGCGFGSLPSTKTKSSKIIYPDDGIYPVKSDDVLKVWSNSLPTKDANNDPIGVAWKEMTGVNVEFEQPMEGSSEALSLLVASDDLPDIIIANLHRQVGGVQKFVDDEVVISLNEHMQFAPHLKSYLDSNPDIDKMAKSDDGNYYMFPFIRGDEKLTVSSGPVIRRDLLKKGGMEVPETIDEWYAALSYFKSLGATAPLSYDLLYWEGQEAGMFIGAYGTRIGFYIEDGNVKYGVLDPSFKDAVANLHKWYKEGLLDKNIVKVSGLDTNIMNSDTAATALWRRILV
jgi:putative aldouronate transport system substrate-binding protein